MPLSEAMSTTSATTTTAAMIRERLVDRGSLRGMSEGVRIADREPRGSGKSIPVGAGPPLGGSALHGHEQAPATGVCRRMGLAGRERLTLRKAAGEGVVVAI